MKLFPHMQTLIFVASNIKIVYYIEHLQNIKCAKLWKKSHASRDCRSMLITRIYIFLSFNYILDHTNKYENMFMKEEKKNHTNTNPVNKHILELQPLHETFSSYEAEVSK